MASSATRPRTAAFRAVTIAAAAALASGLSTALPAAAAISQSSTTTAKATPAARAGQHTYQTPQQVSARAMRTGKKVLVAGATSPTSTLTANPNGSYTLTESAAPVRTKIHGTWRNLNASLTRNSRGGYSPAVSSMPLALSGGGTGPLATMTDGPYSLALTAPMRLPAPVVSGNTATYRGVLPGVDLIVTAQPSGGFSEVFRVATAQAAASPELQALTFTTHTTGLTLSSGSGRTITARTRTGQAIFTAPTPQMWDSAVKPAPKITTNGPVTPASQASRQPPVSTPGSPGPGEHTALLGISVTGNRVTLAPDRQLLTGAGAVYPEYIDPTWDAAGPAASSWAYVSSNNVNQSYYDTSSLVQVGDAFGTSYGFYTLPIPSQVYGAVIHSATAYFPDVWDESCTASTVSLWQVGSSSATTLSTSTTYSSYPAWDSQLDTQNVAYGWSPGTNGTNGVPGGPPPANDPGCGDNDVAFSAPAVTSIISTAAAQSWPAITFGLRDSGWKQFADPHSSPSGNATMTITYADAPAKPVLSTSPAASCAAGTSVLGNGNVTLDAAVSDKNGTATGSLTVSYTALAAGHTFATNPSMNVSAASGTTAALVVKAHDLENADTSYGTNGQVPVTWTATASDGLPGVPSSPTASCTFIFSTAVPGQPNMIDSSNEPCGTSPLQGGASYTVGAPASFTLTPNSTPSAPAEPTSYTYQLNAGNPVTVTTNANTSPPYSATISITPTRFTDILTVNAVAAGGNIGQANSCVINAYPPANAADQDMTGDNIPDLLTVGGGTTGIPSGLWLADGQGSNGRFNGTVAPTASDIAPLGPQDTGTPASWDGMKIVTGEFNASGFNDIEAYTPGSNVVELLPGMGDGSATTSQESNHDSVLKDTNPVSRNVNYPLQLVNAYNVAGNNQPYPDQIGLFNDPDTAVGAYLAYFAANDAPFVYDSANGFLPYELTNPSPDGTSWTNWTITTDSDTSGTTTSTDMWLWNQATGALDLWELTGLQIPPAGGPATLTYTQIQISTSWNTSTTLATFQATDVNGNAGLITVTSTGQIQSYVWNGTALTQANATQSLVTADHTWLLNDGSTGTVTATDQPGAGTGDTAQNLTGNAGTTWNTQDPIYDPDVTFNGASGYLTSSSSPAVFTPNSSFTVSAWVNPAALGGTVFSQNGTSYSSVKVSSTSSGQWSVAMNTGGTTSNNYTTATGGTALTNVWTSLTLTYDTTNGGFILKLYANGVEVAYLRDTAPPSTTGAFRLGASQAAGAPASFLTGQMADVQVWHSAATPVQPATPGSVFVPVTPVRIMDTRSGSDHIGPVTGPVAANSTTTVTIDGNTIAALPASGITAVAVSATVTSQTASGFLTIFPSATPRPATSAVDFPATNTVTNNTIVPVGPDGNIAIYNATATLQLLIDVTGYFTTDTTPAGASTYTPLASPTRILDTRYGTGAPQAAIPNHQALTLTIAGDNTNGVDIPSTGVTAVALNLTVVPTVAGDTGFLTTYADGQAPPNPLTSNVSYGAFSTDQAGTVILPIPVGADGKIDIYVDNTEGHAVNLVGDLSGYFTTSTTGQHYHPLDSTRILDTRQTTALGANTTRVTAVPPSILVNNPTLILNLTATAEADSGFLVAYPGGAALPATSTLDYGANEDIANLALVNTATADSFAIYNNSPGSAGVIVDTDGYFA